MAAEPRGDSQDVVAESPEQPAEDTARAAAEAGERAEVGPRITHRVVHADADLDATPPDTGAYRVHLIDVGTGLSVLVQGHDFNLLFDGGSGDDNSGITSSANNSRLLAYLWRAIGPSGPRGCQPGRLAADVAADPERSIETVVLSHPHEDHGSMLDEVLRCYAVEHVYDSGAINPRAFYDEFIAAVAAEEGVTYHTATAPPSDKTISVTGTSRTISGPWVQFGEGAGEGDAVALGDGASFRILHADGGPHGDPNQNSIVLRVDLGSTSLLLTGDAESGPRLPPTGGLGDIEQHLVETYADVIDVDILQVGHHGSETSSRQEFLAAVSPEWALIGAGPKKYGSVVLPDASVVSAVTAVVGDPLRVLRTDASDADGCSVADRVGNDNDRPGGCDSHVLEISGG